jgi:hypothetical protein
MTEREQEMCDDLGNGVDSMIEEWAVQRLSDGYALGQLEYKLQQALEVVRRYRG